MNGNPYDIFTIPNNRIEIMRPLLNSNNVNTFTMKIGSSPDYPHIVPNENEFTLTITTSPPVPTIQYFFRVRENDVDHYRQYAPDNYIGDRAYGFFPVPVGASMQISMFRKAGNAQEEDIEILEGVTWELFGGQGDNIPINNSDFFAPPPFEGGHTAYIIARLNEVLYRINIILKPPPTATSPVNITLDFTHSDLNESHQVTRRSNFNNAIAAIRNLPIGESLLADLSNASITVFLAPASYPALQTSYGALEGVALADIGYQTDGNFAFMDFFSLRNKVFESGSVESPNAVIQSADVFRRLYLAEIEDLSIALGLRVLTPRAQAIIARVRNHDPATALEIARLILNADLSQMNALTAPIRVAVNTDDANDKIVQITMDNLHIILNETELGTYQPKWNQLLAHELGHPRHSINSKLNKFRWYTIREFSMNQTLFKLRDETGQNIYNDCGCSGGPGHEKYNPENCEVCTLGNQF